LYAYWFLSCWILLQLFRLTFINSFQFK
jgi:hypothetical protein